MLIVLFDTAVDRSVLLSVESYGVNALKRNSSSVQHVNEVSSVPLVSQMYMMQ
jgi:hypothetical protein